MVLGTRRSPRNHRTTTTTRARTGTGRKTTLGGLLSRRKSPAKREAGWRATLSNPKSTHAGREHAKHELHMRGESAHVPLSTKIKRTLGIHETPRRQRKAAAARRRERLY